MRHHRLKRERLPRFQESFAAVVGDGRRNVRIGILCLSLLYRVCDLGRIQKRVRTRYAMARDQRFTQKLDVYRQSQCCEREPLVGLKLSKNIIRIDVVIEVEHAVGDILFRQLPNEARFA